MKNASIDLKNMALVMKVKVLDYSLHPVILLSQLHDSPPRSLRLFIPDSIATPLGAHSSAWHEELINLWCPHCPH